MSAVASTCCNPCTEGSRQLILWLVRPMKTRASTAALTLGIIVASSLAAGHSYAAPDERAALAKIDQICRCAGLVRTSGVLRDPESQKHFRVGWVHVYASADGRTEKYNFDFGPFGAGHPSKRDFDFKRREIVAFCPADYVLGRPLPAVRNARQRRFCVHALSRLKNCGLEWPRYGEPAVERDHPRGYRVRYRSRPPEEDRKIVFTLVGNTYFAMTPRGTIFAAWIGE